VEPLSAAAFPEPPGAAAERSVARAAGTAVHALLEEAGSTPPDADTDTRLRQCVARVAAPGELDAVLAHARAVWERFASGPLAARLADLAPHVVARELPVWVAAAGEGENDPVGFVAGAIDLLYRDPKSGALVVADYKTDATTAKESEAHAERYRAQGAAYVRAITRALALPAPPRFELWFLTAGVVRRLDL
jgi:ATP-dependent exoDNAse (exonuclease V) beta subunit